MTKSIAYHQFGGFFGGAVGTVLVAYFSSFFGWRGSLQIIALLGLPFVIFFLVGVKAEEAISIRGGKEKVRSSDMGLIGKTFVIILLVSFVSSLGGGARIFLPTFLTKQYGESVVQAGMLSGLTQVIGCLSLVIGGVLADKYNKVSVAAASYILTGISTVIISAAFFPSSMLLLLLALLGFSQYFGGPAMHALTQSVSQESTRGRATGLEFSFLALGGVGASLLTGFLTDLYSITFAFIISSLFIFTAGFLILILKNERL